MRELADFYHDGFAWICRHCSNEPGPDARDVPSISSIYTEGEAESKTPDLASTAVAKWADAARRFLICPKCGIAEDTEVH